MTWWQAEPLARAGAGVRRTAWAVSGPRVGATVHFVAGLGTTRAVAVMRRAGVDAVVTAEDVAATDIGADDWEVAP